MRAAIAGGLVLGSLAALTHAAGTAQITGTIQDPSGQPVSQTPVAVLARFPANPSTPFERFDAQVTTDQNGRFSVTGMPAGKFAICPLIPAASNLLSPCAWEAEPTVMLSAGQSLTIQPIQLQAGADLYIRINDPNGTIASTEGKVAGASLLLGVRSSNGGFLPIPRTAQDAMGFDYHLTVPVGVSLTLSAFSQSYTLTDSNNTPISKQTGFSQTVSLTAGQQFMVALNVK